MNSIDFHNSSTRIPRRFAIAATVALGIRACWPNQETLATSPEMVSNASQEWWSWRGPNGNNIAAAGCTAPTKYEKENVVWQSPVPGRGHSSPVVAGNSIYLTTADKADGTQSVLAFNRDSGKPLWSKTIHRGGIPKENHLKNTEASPTVAFDGQRLIASFYNSSAIWLSGLTTDGEILWQKSVGKFDPQRFKYGYAPSPALFEEAVIVAADYDGDSFIAAIDRATGNQLWKTKRANSTSFSSPIVAYVAGRQQLLLSGGESITSYDPKSGKQLWTAKCLTMATCGTVVWDAGCVFASGGYPKAETACVRADGSGEVVWKNNQKCYEQSILAIDGFIYAVTDAGIAQCWRATDGETMWRERLGGNYSCSPILVGDVIQIFNEQGQGFAFKASPTKFESVGGGKIADDVFATPSVVGNTMYMRMAKIVGGNRQEYLVALR
jgi:outer membrane protein assembly factor BamB